MGPGVVTGDRIWGSMIQVSTAPRCEAWRCAVTDWAQTAGLGTDRGASYGQRGCPV